MSTTTTLERDPMPHQGVVTHTSSTAGRAAIVRRGAPARVVRLRDGRSVALRVARREDAAAVQEFVRSLSERSRRHRFFTPLRELSPDQVDRITRSRPPGHLALVGETVGGTGTRIVAMAQYAACEPLDTEFAIVVDDAWQRQGLGIQLLRVLAEQAARAGLAALAGFVLADNWPMLTLLTRLGCELETDADRYVVRVIKHLDPREFAV